MVFLGLLLAAAAVTAAVGIAMANQGAADLTLFGQSVPFLSAQWQVFLAGAAVAMVFMVGMLFVFGGVGRRLRERRDLRYLREEHEESLSTLEMERRRLRRELDRVRKSGGPPPRGPAAGGPAPGRPVEGRPVEGRPVEGRPAPGRPVAGPAASGQPGRPSGRPAPGPEGPRGGPSTSMAGAAARSSFFDRVD
jgi:hypothetical protein